MHVAGVLAEYAGVSVAGCGLATCENTQKQGTPDLQTITQSACTGVHGHSQRTAGPPWGGCRATRLAAPNPVHDGGVDERALPQRVEQVRTELAALRQRAAGDGHRHRCNSCNQNQNQSCR